MEPTLETIELDVEEVSELLFRIKVEGIDPSPAKVRLVCEADNMAYMFDGRATGSDDIVQFKLPVLKDRLKEGVYQSRVEVLIDNRYFSPVAFNINFKKAVRVVAESVKVVPRKEPEVKVSAMAVTRAQGKNTREPTLRERYDTQKPQTVTFTQEMIKELAKSLMKGPNKK